MRLNRMPVRGLILTAVTLIILAACSQDGENGELSGTQPAATGVSVAAQTPDSRESEGETAQPSPTAAVAPTPGPTATATREPTGALTICMAQEPESLFLYGPDSYAARMVREVIYDGPIDTRDYDFQPVILQKIPSLTDGDASIETVPVEQGQLVVDVAGNVVSLRDGVSVRPAGCYTDDCVVTFSGAGEEGDAGDAVSEVAPMSIEMDRLVVEFSLIDGVAWSDGEPLTAYDSVFSFQVAQDAEIPPRQRTGQQGVTPARRIDPVERTASYEALDETTVRWTGLPGFMDAYYQGNFFVPLPEHQLATLSAQELQDNELSARLPLGWGPYILEEWVEGERIRATRNPNYAAGETPYFDEVIFRFGTDDSLQLPGVLEEGQCDVVTNDALGLDWDAYEGWEASGDVRFYSTPGTAWEHVVFGINPSSQVTWRGDLFEDKRVRQAAALCIDRQAIMNELTGGLSQVPETFVPPDHPLYASAGLAAYDYDPAAGMALLQEAGWRDTNGDGVVEAYGVEGLSDGSPMAFTYLTTSSALRERIAEMIVADLGQCGFRASLPEEAVPPEIFFTPDINSPVFGRAFDMTGFAWLADMLPPCHLYLSSEIPSAETGWSGFNVSGFSNETYDSVCRSARSTIPGMEAYDANNAEAMRIFNDQLPAIPLFVHLKLAVARSDIEGLLLNSTQTGDLWNIENMRRTE